MFNKILEIIGVFKKEEIKPDIRYAHSSHNKESWKSPTNKQTEVSAFKSSVIVGKRSSYTEPSNRRIWFDLYE